jgi:hypothetical protein
MPPHPPVLLVLWQESPFDVVLHVQPVCIPDRAVQSIPSFSEPSTRMRPQDPSHALLCEAWETRSHLPYAL